ncbi:unnamed protein product [Agarophyton chilense]|eukprot:gb/GEZJ01005421.1/.p1 GENE.gb/GEZJ01005421.1/~~gb/GEZJ01005421.1/.p1  ORF type:complete len:592 (+),score=47.14 gb/GEZJ01005421.1/:125-1777(+)
MPTVPIPVSPNWRIEPTRNSFVICPTRQYLSRFCADVARLRRFERQIVLVCSSNSSQSTRDYSVHFSRIIYHGGPLLSHVKSFVEATPDYIVRVPIQDNHIAFRYVTDYVYASSVNISRLSVSDCVQLALSCSKWKCVDFYVAVLRFLVQRNRLITPRQFAVSTPLLWLPQERVAFADYYFLNVQIVMERMHLTQLIDLAFATHAANRTPLCNRVLAQIMESHPQTQITEMQLRRLLPLFQHIQLPDFMVQYMVRSIGHSFRAFSLKPHRASAPAHETRQHVLCQPKSPDMEHSFYSRYLAVVDDDELFWNIVCRNGLADPLIRLVMQSERNMLVHIVKTIARYIEPRRENIETLADMLSDISQMMTTGECDMLLRDMTRIDNWSKRATMLVASVCLHQAFERYETQLPVRLQWAHVGRQPITELTNTSIDGIKFGVQVHSTFDCESKIVLTCRGDENKLLTLYTSIHFVAWIVDTDCRCDSLQLLRRFTDGCLFAFNDDLINKRSTTVFCLIESVTLLNTSDVRNWRLKHGKDCTAQMKIRIELERKQT